MSMEDKDTKHNTHFFLYVILLSLFIVSIVSYYRLIIKNDYKVTYKGFCDPAIEKCFVNYEDGTDENSKYYSKMEKYAPDLYKECGSDITNCKEASICVLGDRNCSKTYCDNNVAGDICSTPPPVFINNNATSTKK